MTPPHLSPILDETTLKRLAAELASVTEQTPTSVLRSDWFRWLIGVCAAAIVAYFTTISAIRDQINAVTSTENGHYQQLKATEESNFGEVIRRMDQMQSDIRELRGEK